MSIESYYIFVAHIQFTRFLIITDMNKTDPTIEGVMTPYSLSQQLRLLIHDRDTGIATLQVRWEMMSRRYLESLRDDTLIVLIDEIVASVNIKISTLIIAHISGSGYNSMNIGDTLHPSGRLLKNARRHVEITGIEYETEILKRIAYDAMDIVSQRREEADYE